MFPPKRVATFFVLCLVIYGLLMAPWPGVRAAYATYFQVAGSLFFGSFGAKDAVRFRPAPDNPAGWDTEVVLTNPGNGTSGTVLHSSRKTGYVPTAVLVSLVLATPLSWSRKWRSLLWGVLVVNAFVALRIGLILVRDLSQDDALRLFELGPSMQKVLAWSVRALVMSPGSYYGFPVLLWVLVTFRARDWHTIFAGRSPPAPARSRKPGRTIDCGADEAR